MVCVCGGGVRGGAEGGRGSMASVKNSELAN